MTTEAQPVRGEGHLISIYQTALEVLWAECSFLHKDNLEERENIREQADELLHELLRKLGYGEVVDWHDKITRRLYP